jgi:hypothetical protein
LLFANSTASAGAASLISELRAGRGRESAGKHQASGFWKRRPGARILHATHFLGAKRPIRHEQHLPLEVSTPFSPPSSRQPSGRISPTLCRIPRQSKAEGGLRDEIQRWALARGLSATVDSAGNLLLCKAASRGMEEAPGVVLQAHLDMVCEKNAAPRTTSPAIRFDRCAAMAGCWPRTRRWEPTTALAWP